MVAAQRAVQGGPPAPDVVLVHEVVVDEQVRVQELNAQRGVERVLALASSRFVADQQQGAA